MLDDKAWWVVELHATIDAIDVSEVDGPYFLSEATERQKSLGDQVTSERWTWFTVASGYNAENAKRHALMAVRG